MKKVLYYTLHWLITTFALLMSWALGGVLAGFIAQLPLAEGDPADLASKLLLVGMLNAALITMLTIATNRYKGFYRWLILALFVFGIQFFLTQMETAFFVSAIGMTGIQIIAILLNGLVVAFLTIAASLAAERVYTKRQSQVPYRFSLKLQSISRPILILSLVVYPLLYIVFGHFVAWQNPELRIFYTGSDEMRSFFSQFINSFIMEGIYPFQILRAFLWVLLSLPLIHMMGAGNGKILLFGLATALLPASLLFLPNAFMPAGIALTHFYETASSNFIWGLAMGALLGRVDSRR